MPSIKLFSRRNRPAGGWHCAQLTNEQNAIASFKSRTTFVPAYANTIGRGLFLKADKIIGGADGSAHLPVATARRAA